MEPCGWLFYFEIRLFRRVEGMRFFEASVVDSVGCGLVIGVQLRNSTDSTDTHAFCRRVGCVRRPVGKGV